MYRVAGQLIRTFEVLLSTFHRFLSVIDDDGGILNVQTPQYTLAKKVGQISQELSLVSYPFQRYM